MTSCLSSSWVAEPWDCCTCSCWSKLPWMIWLLQNSDTEELLLTTMSAAAAAADDDDECKFSSSAALMRPEVVVSSTQCRVLCCCNQLDVLSGDSQGAGIWDCKKPWQQRLLLLQFAAAAAKITSSSSSWARTPAAAAAALFSAPGLAAAIGMLLPGSSVWPTARIDVTPGVGNSAIRSPNSEGWKLFSTASPPPPPPSSSRPSSLHCSDSSSSSFSCRRVGPCCCCCCTACCLKQSSSSVLFSAARGSARVGTADVWSPDEEGVAAACNIWCRQVASFLAVWEEDLEEGRMRIVASEDDIDVM